MECNCTYTLGEEEPQWTFNAEPRVEGVDSDGPSYGKLENGDAIVAIDGMLITTRRAGIRFANLTAGEPIELTVRRWGRTRTETIVPQAVPAPNVPLELTVRHSGRSNDVTVVPRATNVPELARSIEELSIRAAEIGEVIRTMGVPVSPDVAAFPEFNLDFAERTPRGWIGFGLSMSGSIRRVGPEEPAEWRFDEPPYVKSIHPGGPADEAGLRVDDVLLEIDGFKLDSKKGGDRFSNMEPGQVIEWKVRRGGRTLTVETEAVERPPREPEEALRERPGTESLRPLRYTGSLDGTEIEVRGDKNVRVEVDEETGEIVIRSGDSVVRLKPRERK
jgi:membrane-associated protease RseP (regulator of RpoE activity)